ncbi:MAG: phage minor capsid protein [Lachnospiraceae bacterium]
MRKINTEYDIGKALEAIEDELIASMIRNMKRHKVEEVKEDKQWSMWQAEQLKNLEKYRKENRKKFKKPFAKINEQMEELIRIARDEGEMDQEIEILDAIKKGFSGEQVSKESAAEFFKVNDRKLNALIQATTDDMEKAETAVLRRADDQYRKAIFNAQMYANTGAGTYEKAVDMALKDMLAAGLTCIEYKNGARHTLSDYADMAIRTACKRAYLQGEGQKRQEWGIHTVIVNKRGNPCPKCLPFVGKVLIDDVWSGGSRKDGKYPLMSYAIECGLYHPRCKDSHTTYFPGISTADDTWTKEELEEIGLVNKQEARQQYASRQADKYGRLAKYSLDWENQEKYRKKKEEWKKNSKSGTIKLPRYQEAVIPRAKFTEYALNPLKDANKAEAFRKALGYTLDNVDALIEQINQKLPEYDAVEKGDRGWGMTYEVVMDITGPNGKTAKVLTAWIDDKNSGEMRLTTIHVDK